METAEAPAKRFTSVTYDKFHSKNETTWKDPMNGRVIGGKWTPYFYSKNTMKGDKPFTDRLHINLRHVKTPDLDSYLLDYEYLATDWMFIKNGLLIVNLDGVDNIKLAPHEIDTKVKDGGIINEWGYWEISLDDLKKIGNAKEVDIRMSGNSSHIDFDAKAKLKFLFMVKSFLADTQNDSSHDEWLDTVISKAEQSSSGGSTGLIVAGYICAVIFPLFALVIGGYLRFATSDTKKQKSGTRILIASIVVSILYFILLRK